jgi:hypothetical protein
MSTVIRSFLGQPRPTPVVMSTPVRGAGVNVHQYTSESRWLGSNRRRIRSRNDFRLVLGRTFDHRLSRIKEAGTQRQAINARYLSML